MTLDELNIENQVYREMINKLKRFINECDEHIQTNETEIGRQLEAMNKTDDCDLCLGECNGNV